jgi:transcriptional regulator with XRE-family HTH domain
MDLSALPSCQKTLRTARPKVSVYEVQFKRYPEHPNTLGEWLRQRRLDLHIRQRDLARQLGVSLTAVQGWELGRFKIGQRFEERIRAFAGLPLRPEPKTLGDRLRRRRLQMGFTQLDVAGILGVHVASVQHWEYGQRTVPKSKLAALALFLG